MGRSWPPRGSMGCWSRSPARKMGRRKVRQRSPGRSSASIRAVPLLPFCGATSSTLRVARSSPGTTRSLRVVKLFGHPMAQSPRPGILPCPPLSGTTMIAVPHASCSRAHRGVTAGALFPSPRPSWSPARPSTTRGRAIAMRAPRARGGTRTAPRPGTTRSRGTPMGRRFSQPVSPRSTTISSSGTLRTIMICMSIRSSASSTAPSRISTYPSLVASASTTSTRQAMAGSLTGWVTLSLKTATSPS